MIALRTAAACAGVTLALCVGATQVHAAKPVAPPTAPCDEDHILDLHIVDGVWFECSCEERIFIANDCEWQEITSAAHDPHHAPIRKAKKHKRLIPALYIKRVVAA